MPVRAGRNRGSGKVTLPLGAGNRGDRPVGTVRQPVPSQQRPDAKGGENGRRLQGPRRGSAWEAPIEQPGRPLQVECRGTDILVSNSMCSGTPPPDAGMGRASPSRFNGQKYPASTRYRAFFTWRQSTPPREAAPPRSIRASRAPGSRPETHCAGHGLGGSSGGPQGRPGSAAREGGRATLGPYARPTSGKAVDREP